MSCPKCKGNVFFERNVNYNFEKKQYEKTGWCLQCGYTVYLTVENPSQQLSATATGK
jgi:predicted nucleic-acid-binding Zn-ribbon protein